MKYITVIIASFYLASCSLFSDFSEPKMEVLKENTGQNISVRAYDPALIMSVAMPHKHDDSLNDGFMILLDYIRGDNAQNMKIDMTAPVLREFRNDMQIVSFFAPKHFTAETLPVPTNDKIIISEWKPQNPFAVIQFSGRWTKENFTEQKVLLESYIQDNKRVKAGTTYYAYYNDPMTPWFMRKNEILIEIQ